MAERRTSCCCCCLLILRACSSPRTTLSRCSRRRRSTATSSMQLTSIQQCFELRRLEQRAHTCLHTSTAKYLLYFFNEFQNNIACSKQGESIRFSPPLHKNTTTTTTFVYTTSTTHTQYVCSTTESNTMRTQRFIYIYYITCTQLPIYNTQYTYYRCLIQGWVEHQNAQHRASMSMETPSLEQARASF